MLSLYRWWWWWRGGGDAQLLASASRTVRGIYSPQPQIGTMAVTSFKWNSNLLKLPDQSQMTSLWLSKHQFSWYLKHVCQNKPLKVFAGKTAWHGIRILQNPNLSLWRIMHFLWGGFSHQSSRALCSQVRYRLKGKTSSAHGRNSSFNIPGQMLSYKTDTCRQSTIYKLLSTQFLRIGNKRKNKKSTVFP